MYNKSIYFKALSFLILVSASVFTFAQETTYTGIEFTGLFGGTAYDGNYYNFPSGSEVWGGFANEDVSIYPLTFTDGGQITFTGSTAGTDAEVYFRFEYNPYPDTEPSFNTISVTISGLNNAPYSIDIPSQGGNTYSSFILYVATPDAPVSLTDVSLTATFSSTDVYGCIDPLAVDYNINATSQLMDQYGNIMCTYDSCENTPGNGCMYANSFGPFNEWFGAYECELYGGTPCTDELSGCMDANATNYDASATAQAYDQYGNLICIYASCDDIPEWGCIYADGFGAFNAEFGADLCITYGGTPCEEPVAADVLTMTTTVCDAATSVAMTGPWWGWDPNGGPAASDNGDGSWTFTFDPAPTDNMEYLLVVDGVQEDLVASSTASEDWSCAPITDYWSYANRQWVVGSGDVSNVYGQCGDCIEIVLGCMYSNADNYNALANDDDGSCLFAADCVGDLDGDGLAGTSDLLLLLSGFGNVCE